MVKNEKFEYFPGHCLQIKSFTIQKVVKRPNNKDSTKLPGTVSGTAPILYSGLEPKIPGCGSRETKILRREKTFSKSDTSATKDK